MKTLEEVTPADFCRQHGACADGAAFAGQFTSPAEAWDACPRADWMLWALRRMPELKIDELALRRLACRFARSTPLKDGRTTWDLMTDRVRELIPNPFRTPAVGIKD